MEMSFIRSLTDARQNHSSDITHKAELTHARTIIASLLVYCGIFHIKWHLFSFSLCLSSIHLIFDSVDCHTQFFSSQRRCNFTCHTFSLSSFLSLFPLSLSLLLLFFTVLSYVIFFVRIWWFSFWLSYFNLRVRYGVYIWMWSERKKKLFKLPRRLNVGSTTQHTHTVHWFSIYFYIYSHKYCLWVRVSCVCALLFLCLSERFYNIFHTQVFFVIANFSASIKKYHEIKSILEKKSPVLNGDLYFIFIPKKRLLVLLFSPIIFR